MDIKDISKKTSYVTVGFSLLFLTIFSLTSGILLSEDIYGFYLIGIIVVLFLLLLSLRYSDKLISRVFITIVVAFSWFSVILNLVSGGALDVFGVLLLDLPLTIYLYYLYKN